jgi:uncharacterized protein
MFQAPTSELTKKATELIRQKLSNVLASYVFGSQVTENSSKDSDLDLAVLVAGYADVVGLYECAMLSEMTALNEARAGLIADIKKSGTIYG